MENNKLKVTIGGNIYTIISSKPKTEIEKIANYVDEEITKITSQNYRLNPIMASTLVALNMAEEYFDLKSELEKISEDTDYPLKKQEEINNLNSDLQIENTELKNEIISLKEELKKLIDIIENLNKRHESMENLSMDYSKKISSKSNEVINLQKDIIKLKDENIYIQKDLINKLNKIEKDVKNE